MKDEMMETWVVMVYTMHMCEQWHTHTHGSLKHLGPHSRSARNGELWSYRHETIVSDTQAKGVANHHLEYGIPSDTVFVTNDWPCRLCKRLLTSDIVGHRDG